MDDGIVVMHVGPSGLSVDSLAQDSASEGNYGVLFLIMFILCFQTIFLLRHLGCMFFLSVVLNLFKEYNQIK